MSNKKLLVIFGAVFLLLVVVITAIVMLVLRNAGPVTLTYWGLWEPDSVYSTVIADYRRLHPNVIINYAKQSTLQYRERMMTAMAGDNGPDIVRFHNSWLPMMAASLVSVPSDVFSPTSFRSTFYPVAVSDLTIGGKPYGIPLEIDTLAMYVNQDIFRTAGLSVPTVWQGDNGLDVVAQKLTVKDGNGRIKTSGAALGSAVNVDHWQDILTLMMLQSGVDLNSEISSDKAAKALDFYSAFVKTYRTWDETLDNSTLAFAEGKVAIYFGPSWRFFDFDEFKKSSNPNLNFKVMPVPQLTGGDTVNFATYWAEGVSKKSKHQKEAFDFLKFISSPSELEKLYTAESKIRRFGEIYSRKEMATRLAADPNAGVFVSAAPTAESWYLVSSTGDGDTGINSKLSKYFGDAVNAVVRGGDSKSALNTAAAGVAQILGQYGLNR